MTPVYRVFNLDSSKFEHWFLLGVPILALTLGSCGYPALPDKPFSDDEIVQIQVAIQSERECEEIEKATPVGWTADTVKVLVKCVNIISSDEYSVTIWRNGSFKVDDKES